uniref:Putative arginine kinase n=1 Tax=Pinctada fucata TaxID=50426 RepID=A0A194AK72_PINFU
MPEGYEVFSDLLDAVIKDYHKVPEVKHPKPSFGDMDNLGFGDLDPSGEMIVSTRVRVGRSHSGFPFPPCATKEQRVEMEKITVEALNTLEGELKGKYTSLGSMTKEEEKQLVEDHFLFKDDDPMLRDAGGYNDWPTGRGIFFSADKKFLVWINEEDHLRFISMQKGGNLAEVYKRLVKAIHALEKKLTFAKTDRHGYLTFCPTNLGTTMRASVHIKVPNLAKDMEKFNGLCAKLNLQPRGIHGEHTESVGGVYDISNKRRLGLSEFEAITEMRKGIEEIIKAEKAAA